ncbi:MAG: hypothetical protein AAB383_05395 [Patescibacteria group bacterium]
MNSLADSTLENMRESLDTMSPIKRVGLIGGVLAGVLAAREAVVLAYVNLTESHERITVENVSPENKNFGNLWGLTYGEGKTVETTDGETLEDRPAWALGKFEPINLDVGSTYDVSTYKWPMIIGETNIRSATPVDKEEE